ncbi:hypothetical protein M9H77_33059 [Catharanthus roseus]|uniref:Uncharacterized protein n=1 Tax=Catharanthus roseus TaxID=4058 RepID=A0ACC0A4N5_CATRO|nr:hypothetical protein M9H77_33059 [Catharanthus roseus]
MKFSLKVEDFQQNQQQNHHHQPLLLRAKIPITIFNLPFLSGFCTTTHHPSDLSLSLSTNFSSGPSLKLAYSTTSASAPAASTSPQPPFTLTFKSGIGVFGSPKDSPLIISANFSFSPYNLNSSPTFSLLLKPQLGSFSLRKSTVSDPNSGAKANGETANSFGFVPLERPMSLKDFSLDTKGKDSILKGISVMARTEMPVAKRISMNFRWGVNFPEDLSKQMPTLTVNKVGIERVDEVKEVDKMKDKKSDGNTGDMEVLKGMCLWMKRELDMLQRENREMKYRLEEMNMGNVGKIGKGISDNNVKKTTNPVVERSNGFEQWRSKKNGGEERNVNKEVKKNGNLANDVENELQRAIKAASSQ